MDFTANIPFIAEINPRGEIIVPKYIRKSLRLESSDTVTVIIFRETLDPVLLRDIPPVNPADEVEEAPPLERPGWLPIKVTRIEGVDIEDLSDDPNATDDIYREVYPDHPDNDDMIILDDGGDETEGDGEEEHSDEETTTDTQAVSWDDDVIYMEDDAL